MYVTETTHDGYRVVISAGGVSILGDGWDYTSNKIKPPNKKPGKKKLVAIAKEIVNEYDLWRSVMLRKPVST